MRYDKLIFGHEDVLAEGEANEESTPHVPGAGVADGRMAKPLTGADSVAQGSQGWSTGFDIESLTDSSFYLVLSLSQLFLTPTNCISLQHSDEFPLQL